MCKNELFLIGKNIELYVKQYFWSSISVNVNDLLNDLLVSFPAFISFSIRLLSSSHSGVINSNIEFDSLD